MWRAHIPGRRPALRPATYIAARYTLSDNIPELDWAGGLCGQPMEVIEGEVTGLPFPARSELVLEGWVSPDETALEGPFGEWTGYYAGDAKQEPVIHIERVYIELLTYEGRQTGGDTLPHLGAGGVKANSVVREDLQEGIRGPSTLGAGDR